MTSNESKNEMLVMVLTDLAALCKKLGENSALPEGLRREARQFAGEYDLLLPFAGQGNAAEHFEGEYLIEKITRFLPNVLTVRAEPTVTQRN